jgi:hypothetical protein
MGRVQAGGNFSTGISVGGGSRGPGCRPVRGVFAHRFDEYTFGYRIQALLYRESSWDAWDSRSRTRFDHASDHKLCLVRSRSACPGRTIAPSPAAPFASLQSMSSSDRCFFVSLRFVCRYDMQLDLDAANSRPPWRSPRRGQLFFLTGPSPRRRSMCMRILHTHTVNGAYTNTRAPSAISRAISPQLLYG